MPLNYDFIVKNKYAAVLLAMHAYAPRMCLVPMEARRGHWVAWN